MCKMVSKEKDEESQKAFPWDEAYLSTDDDSETNLEEPAYQLQVEEMEHTCSVPIGFEKSSNSSYDYMPQEFRHIRQNEES